MKRSNLQSSASGTSGGGAGPKGPWAKAKYWLRTRNPILKFLSLFGGLLAVFYIFTQLRFFKEMIFPWNVKINAVISNAILHLLGQNTKVMGSKIVSTDFAVDIHRGCDAIEPIAFFVFALVAFPAPIKRKMSGIAAGVVILFGLNLVRIVSLYLAGLKSEKLFEFLHADAWQILFILVAIVLWGFWSFWATQSRVLPATAPKP